MHGPHALFCYGTILLEIPDGGSGGVKGQEGEDAAALQKFLTKESQEWTQSNHIIETYANHYAPEPFLSLHLIETT